MSLERWTAFLGVLFVVLITPGPDFAVVMRHAATGARAGAGAAAGIVTGLGVHTLAAAAGLSALVAAYPRVLSAITVVGAGYLFVLGVLALRAGLRPSACSAPPAPPATHPVRDGLAGNLLNPKAMLFFLGLIPQFLAPDRPAAPQILLMAATTIAAAVLWWCVVIAVTARGVRLLQRPRSRRVVDAVCGAALVGVSLAVVRS